ncbi:hypothetical protein [Peijinzhouia sedimentorum]
MNFSKLLFTTLFVLLFQSAIAQIQTDDVKELSTMERIYGGGNFSLGFGNITFVDISPLAGYMITPQFSAGLGATYQYLRYNNFDQSANVYGGRIFMRHNIMQRFFAHAEYESMSVEYPQYDDNLNVVVRREWVPGLLVGGGIFNGFGERGGMNLTVLYNLVHDNIRSPYGSPLIIRAGFIF